MVLFDDTQDTAWLDTIDQRFVWFKKQMVNFEEVLAPTFPKDWEIKRRFAAEFCNLTSQELSKVNNIVSKRYGVCKSFVIIDFR